MVAVRLHAVITEDRKLIVELPPDLPPGEVEIIIRQHIENPERDTLRAAMAAAGWLSNIEEIPEEFEDDDDTPLDLLPGARPSEELINEDREERF